MKKFSLLICISLCALFAVPANASYIYSFEAITANSIWRNDPGLIITMELFDVGSNQVEFKFQNSSTIAGTVAEIYFEQGAFQSIASINWGSQREVNFTSPANPSILPSSNTVAPSFDAAFSTGAKNPAPKNGLSSGEWLSITLNLAPGRTFYDVISYLNSQTQGRVGLHVTGLPTATSATTSDSFINVPEPATLAVLTLGSAALITRKKK